MTEISDSDPEEEREWLDSLVDIDRLGLLTLLGQPKCESRCLQVTRRVGHDIVEGAITGVRIVMKPDEVGAMARALASWEAQAPHEAGR